MTPAYPFSAIVGQEELKLALILNAVDPSIGGLLIRGERGTAKSTAARGLAALLPFSENGKSAPFVELPLGATEDRIVGSLDVERALREGKQKLRSGLLAAADGGVLYVDEVNLLPDHLVDLLLDAAASGRVTIERDGISATETARFILLGSMNPEEGELRPQFLDRFGLCVEVKAPADTALRVETVRRRLHFEASTEPFTTGYDGAQQNLREQILAARQRITKVVLDDALLNQSSTLCAQLKLDGIRGDITLVKTARALAAWENAPRVTAEHVRQAARLALPHRKRRKPFEPVGNNQSELDRHLPPPASEPEAEGEKSSTQPSPTTNSASSAFESAASNERPAPPGKPSGPVEISVKLASNTASGRRPSNNGAQGGVIRNVPLTDADSLAVAPTLIAAASRGAGCNDKKVSLQQSDLRAQRRAGRGAARVLFVVDASGSMAAERRLSLAKGAATSLLTGSYQRRDEVALLVFRNEEATLIQPFTRTVDHLELSLRDVPTGGRTPLALALHEAGNLARKNESLILVLFTDGRANVPFGDGDPWQQSLDCAQMLSEVIAGAVVVDCEAGLVRLERAALLAEKLGAECIQLDKLDSAGLTLHVQKRLSAS